MVGRMGFSLVTGLRGFDIPEAAGHLNAYRAALREAGHAGDGNVYLRIPVYVAATRGPGARGAGREHHAVLSPARREFCLVGRGGGDDRFRKSARNGRSASPN